eukprot:1160336-Pelagomonas_calceolata.AAC.6
MVSLYYEDSRVSPGMVNLGVRKALWPIVQKMNEALRMYENCTGVQRRASVHHADTLHILNCGVEVGYAGAWGLRWLCVQGAEPAAAY